MEETISDVRDKIREKLGSPSTVDMSDTVIENYITDALDDFFNIQPKSEYRTITLVASTATYTVDSDVIDVKDVVFAESSDLADSIAEDYNDENLEPGLRTLSSFENPSLAQIMFQKIDSVYIMDCQDWYYDASDNTITIYPTPEQSGYLAYLANLEPELADVPKKFKKPFYDLILGECMRWIGRKRNSEVKGVSFSSTQGRADFDDGRQFTQEGKELIASARARLGYGASSIAMG